MQVPRLEKIVINMGVGKAVQDRRSSTTRGRADQDQRPEAGREPGAKSVANFKLRKGMPIGCKVTLRRERMYEFLDRLITIALPRVRDFRGVSPKSFDGRGNYALGREGADRLPRDQLRRGRGDAGHGHHHLHDGADRRTRPRRLLEGFDMPFRK